MHHICQRICYRSNIIVMDKKTKLIFALEHIAHLHDLFEDNEWNEHLESHLIPLEHECERQLSLLFDERRVKHAMQQGENPPYLHLNRTTDWIP